MRLSEIFKEHSVVGIVGNRSTGKSMNALTELLDIRLNNPEIPICVLGVEDSLRPILQSYNIIVLESEMDILDLQIKNSVIFIDEFASIFDTATRSKQLEKLERFFDRIEHTNCKLLVGTAREGFWNKFACARITAFIVKEIEYSALVNGTWLKERVCAIRSLSDYRLECPKDKSYIVSNKFGLTKKVDAMYYAGFDTKKDNKKLFG